MSVKWRTHCESQAYFFRSMLAAEHDLNKRSKVMSFAISGRYQMGPYTKDSLGFCNSEKPEESSYPNG
ncbi:hypothetical protein TNCV_3779111 [Trichonephila clavipes]|nr:hypothetical protein TNCV_3779111 [Trichonephila clavipes]